MGRSSENNFENEWQKAFEDAEERPSELVWHKISKDISKPSKFHYLIYLLFVPLLLFFGYCLISYNSRSGTNSKSTVALDTSSFDEKRNRKKKKKMSSKDTKSKQGILNSSQSKTSNKSNTYLSQNFNLIGPKNTPQNSFLSKQISSEEEGVIVPTKTLSSQKASNKISQDKTSLKNYAFIDAPLLIKDTLLISKSSVNPERTPQDKSKKAKGKFYIELNAALYQTQSNLKADYQQYVQDYIEAHQVANISLGNFSQNLQEQISSSFTQEYGFRLGYNFNSKIALDLGINYGRTSLNLTTNALYNAEGIEKTFLLEDILYGEITDVKLLQAIGNSSHYNPMAESNDLNINDLNASEKSDLRLSYDYISIPLRLHYTINPNNRLRYSFFLGTSADIVISRDTSSDLSEALNTINWYFQAGLGLSYEYSSKFSFFAQPTLRSSFANLLSNTQKVSINPRLIGVNLGTRIKF